MESKLQLLAGIEKDFDELKKSGFRPDGSTLLKIQTYIKARKHERAMEKLEHENQLIYLPTNKDSQYYALATTRYDLEND